MSAGPSQQKRKAGGSKNSEDAHLAFKAPAEIDRALAVGGNVDGVVKGIFHTLSFLVVSNSDTRSPQLSSMAISAHWNPPNHSQSVAEINFC